VVRSYNGVTDRKRQRSADKRGKRRGVTTSAIDTPMGKGENGPVKGRMTTRLGESGTGKSSD